MSLRLCAAVALALAAVAAPNPATAQAQEMVPADDVLAQMPKELAGAAALKMPNSALITYFPKALGRDPMFGVIATKNDKIDPQAVMGSDAREAFHESGIRRVLREGTFTAPRFPGAKTFFGEYHTGTGFKQSWTVMTGRERVSVIATFFDKKDQQRIQAEVAEKVFGGAVVSADKPAE